MSIPLVQNNEKDSINTSIIAIKRQIERINMLLGLSNSEEIDTSKFATKDELQQAVTDLQPVDEVTVGNMQSVTSNAVMNKILAVRDYLTAMKSTDFWVAFLPSYTIIEKRNIGGRRLLLEFGVYQYNTNFYIQISWGTTDAILQQSTGYGRTNFITYNASSAYLDIQAECKHFFLSLDIPEGSPIVGIQSNTDVFFRNLSIH